MAAALLALKSPRRADPTRPWVEGNDFAAQARKAMGWGDEPAPELEGWLTEQGLAVSQRDEGLAPSIYLIAARNDRGAAMIHVNPRGHRKAVQETGLATALGRLLLEPGKVSIDGEWSAWASSARARAFGVALMLPEDGIRRVLGHQRVVEAEGVRDLMTTYRTGAWATTHRLKNLRLIDQQQQVELIRQLQ